MSELLTDYTLEHPADGDWSWTARFRLPEVTDRDIVLAEIDRSVQALKYNHNIPLNEVAVHGLSGVLLGPKGDNDAVRVRDVVFATDPSRTEDARKMTDMDRHAVRIAELNNWRWVDIDGRDHYADEELPDEDFVRVIMGRNLDKYVGKEVATFDQARALLPTDTSFELQGGYLFSDRPGKKLYGEAAIVATMHANLYTSDSLQQLFRLAVGLNYQDRFVLETPDGAEVYQLNSD